MRSLELVLLALSLTACVPSDKKQDPGGAPSASVSPPNEVARVPTTPAVSANPFETKTDGREIAAGKRLHADANQGCADLGCLGAKCGKLCSQFMAETYKDGDFRSVRHRNTIFFNCQGACLDEPD